MVTLLSGSLSMDTVLINRAVTALFFDLYLMTKVKKQAVVSTRKPPKHLQLSTLYNDTIYIVTNII